ncbi:MULTISPECIES: TY-Chap domain-containing protein [Microbacterium]|uniref:TY-Chap domain-containing protein n=1 Tax=Microbacterium TaxID=33882 RepID=UPI001E424DE9|nr:hypothetical protein [Microbacterium nymphoidis]MCD2497714.1 hypothetical protein [Microbacterium nymphoidis]
MTDETSAVREALANLFEHLIREDDPWVVEVVREAVQRPYVQGTRNDDGSIVIEVSSNEINDPPLSGLQIAALRGWGFSAGSDDVSPNHARVFPEGADREAAELLADALVTVLRFSGDDAVHIELFESDLTEVLENNPDLPLADL